MDDEATERAGSRIGLVIDEKYRIDEVLGVGGTAAVFAATHRNGHRVALKMLHLGAAHAALVIHRDVKPANLFLTAVGELKVLDFGVARLLEGASITGTGELWGTAAFMPPEQAFGDRSLDHRCDLWAVGAVVFRLLSGRDVHVAPNDHQQLLLAATRHASPLAAVEPDVPTAVCEVVDKALRFDRTERWDSAGPMQSAFRKTCEYERL